MESNINKEAMREVAKKFNLPLYVIEKVIDAVYLDLKNTIEDDTRDGYMLPYFGKFYQSEGKLLNLKIIKQLKHVGSQRKLQNRNTELESFESGIQDMVEE